MTVETPQPRDRVRVILEGPYVEDDTGRCVELADGETYGIPDAATVEVLERADDPTLDPIWTVREVEPKPPAAVSNIVVKFGDSYWLYPSNMGNGYGRLDWANVRESKVIGAVPGTPAAEAADAAKIMDTSQRITSRLSVRLPNEPHGIPDAVRQRVVDAAIAEGRTAAAQELQRHVGIPWRHALDYVDDLPEYQAFLSEHGRTEVDEDEADRMRAMGFDKQPEVKISDEDRTLIRSVLLDRQGEYFDGNLYTEPLAGVVADIVYAVRVQDRKRGDR